MKNGTKVRVRETKITGTVVSSELKRYANINRGREIRFVLVKQRTEYTTQHFHHCPLSDSLCPNQDHRNTRFLVWMLKGVG